MTYTHEGVAYEVKVESRPDIKALFNNVKDGITKVNKQFIVEKDGDVVIVFEIIGRITTGG